MEGSREVASLISILLVLLYQRFLLLLSMQLFVLRRSKRRRLRLRFLRTVKLVIRQLDECRRRRVTARAPKSVWALPRPQQLLNDRALDHWWRENFRLSRATLEHICQLVGPVLRRQNARCNSCWEESKRKKEWSTICIFKTVFSENSTTVFP